MQRYKHRAFVYWAIDLAYESTLEGWRSFAGHPTIPSDTVPSICLSHPCNSWTWCTRSAFQHLFPYLYYVCMLMFTQCLLLTYVLCTKTQNNVLLQSFHYQCTSYSSLWNTCLPCDFLTHLSCWHWNSSKECLHRSQSASTSEQANTHHTQLMRVLTTQKQNTVADRANRDAGCWDW